MNGLQGNSALSARQARAITCLLSEATLAAAASKARVGETTLRRWLRDAAFIQVYQLARQESYRESLRLLRRVANSAITTLARIMQDDATPKSVRVRAAEVILEHDRKGVVEEDLLTRIAALEERMPDAHYQSSPTNPPVGATGAVAARRWA
jgi:uncharacterized protein (UPF0147 family)